jgi:hypothetical protein
MMYRTHTPSNVNTPEACLGHHLELVDSPIVHGEGCVCTFVPADDEAIKHIVEGVHKRMREHYGHFIKQWMSSNQRYIESVIRFAREELKK